MYVRQGFKGQAEPLGTNYAAACEHARLLTTPLRPPRSPDMASERGRLRGDHRLPEPMINLQNLTHTTQNPEHR